MSRKRFAGDIVSLVGLETVDIADSICDPLDPQPLDATEIEPPTLTMMFSVNDSPFVGKEGKYVTSRNLRERLFKELESNVALKVEETAVKDAFKVSGRGLLHLGILIENMRREGYELSISKPHVIVKKDESGNMLEPIEYLVIDVPEKNLGGVMELVGNRRGEMVRMDNRDGQVHLEFTIPARGLIGLRTRMLTATQGQAVMHHNFHEYAPLRGDVPSRANGVMISNIAGKHQRLRPQHPSGSRRTVRRTRRARLRRPGRRRALPPRRHRRQPHQGQEAVQHAHHQQRRKHHPQTRPKDDPRAGPRIHRRGRAGRSNPQEHPPAKGSADGKRTQTLQPKTSGGRGDINRGGAMTRPNIGITIDTHDDAGKYESPCAYTKAIERAGGLPLLIPYQSDLSLIPQFVDQFDGILFTGGNDLDPALYGQSWHPKATESIPPARISNWPSSPKSKNAAFPPSASASAPN